MSLGAKNACRQQIPMALICGLCLTAAICLLGCRESIDPEASQPAPLETPRTAKASHLQPVAGPQPSRIRRAKYLPRLSQYELFVGPQADLKPADRVVPYDVNTALFSDYAFKHRVIRLPEGTAATFNPSSVFEFPVGTVIAKTFYYRHVISDPTQGRRLIETRILIHKPAGWVGLPYIWDDAQSDATLALTGGAVDVQWIHGDGESRNNTHLVPNFNDCKRCHENEHFEPIGPKASNLNRELDYAGDQENQLDHWSRVGILRDLPSPDQRPQMAVWDDESSGSLEARARAWMDVNCAHCHSPIGPARNSGLHLHADVDVPYRLGVFKTPVAAGRGTGGRLYDIVPGKPDESILMYRLETDRVGEMMPEIGRSLVDREGTELIRQWIEAMPSENESP